MTTAVTATAARRAGMATAFVAAACAALVLRPVLIAHVEAVPALVALFVLILVVSLAWPVIPPRVPPAAVRWAVLAAGVAAFAAGRLIGGGHPPVPAASRFLVLGALAAVAEEAFFRRLVFAVLSPQGPWPAVLSSSVLFAVVHVTVYGPAVLPLDLAAGLLLGWQRHASGTWTVPAVTHVIANLLVVL